jgi:hypothetical protein
MSPEALLEKFVAGELTDAKFGEFVIGYMRLKEAVSHMVSIHEEILSNDDLIDEEYFDHFEKHATRFYESYMELD